MILAALVPVTAAWRLGTPVDIGRDEARELARDELSKPSYDRDRPWLQRALDWVIEHLARLIDGAAGALSSQVGVAILVALVLAVAVFVILRTGPMARRARQRTDPVFADGRRSSAHHRHAADQAADAGDWRAAVVERFRTVVAVLEERGVIEERSGRTADEVAREAGSVLTRHAVDLAAAAALFDLVLYGNGDATAADHDRLRALDDAVGAARADPGATPVDMTSGAPR